MEEQREGKGPKGGKMPPGVYRRGGILCIRYGVNGTKHREPVPEGEDGSSSARGRRPDIAASA